MREIEIKNEEQALEFIGCDRDDLEALLSNIDDELEAHGLELVIGADWDDDFVRIKVEKRQ